MQHSPVAGQLLAVRLGGATKRALLVVVLLARDTFDDLSGDSMVAGLLQPSPGWNSRSDVVGVDVGVGVGSCGLQRWRLQRLLAGADRGHADGNFCHKT